MQVAGIAWRDASLLHCCFISIIAIETAKKKKVSRRAGPYHGSRLGGHAVVPYHRTWVSVQESAAAPCDC